MMRPKPMDPNAPAAIADKPIAARRSPYASGARTRSRNVRFVA